MTTTSKTIKYILIFLVCNMIYNMYFDISNQYIMHWFVALQCTYFIVKAIELKK
jgi:hypothetical protein